jgi:hypothetical protein
MDTQIKQTHGCMSENTIIDLAVLRERLRASLPHLTLKLVELEHSDTRERHPALLIETSERKKDHVYRMTVMVAESYVNFFVHVHVHGTSKDLSTQGAQCFHKACADVDEVFAIVHACWTGGVPS